MPKRYGEMSKDMSDAVLVTGGAGYIGSHATLCLLEAGYSGDFQPSCPNDRV